MENSTNSHFKSYVWAFILSIVLTLAAYFFVVEKVFSPGVLLGVIIGLGVVQAFVQLVLFLHLGREGKPHWNTLTFLFMLSILLIVVIGSLWIMNHLEYNMMPGM